MTYRIPPLAIFLLALFLPTLSFAACSGPAGNAGDMMYNSGSYVYQYCDGTYWHAMGPTGTSGSCTGPTGSNGDMMYNSGSHVYQFCAGQWIAMGPTGAGGTCFLQGSTSNLVGWWKLTDGSGASAADSSGNSNTGTLENTPTWITTGPNGGGLTLNGSNQYVDVPDKSWLELSGSWTVSAWVNLNAIPASGNFYVLMDKDNSTATNYGIGVDNGLLGTGLGWYVIYNSTGCCDNRYARYTTSISTGTWYLVTGVYDSSAATLTLYLNGASVATFNATGLPPESGPGDDLGIGLEIGNTGYLNGTADDARVYNVALTAAQVAALVGNEADIMYNSSNSVMQYCNGTWVGMGY